MTVPQTRNLIPANNNKFEETDESISNATYANLMHGNSDPHNNITHNANKMVLVVFFIICV